MDEIKTMRLYGTTSAEGAVTIKGTRSVLGELVAVQWIDGDLADGVGFTLSTINTEAANNLLVVANANSDKMYYPKEIPHKTEDGAALTATSGGDRVFPIMDGIPQLAITSGGDSKSGGCILFFRE
ncbi:MAG: hypothetical protein C0391_03900 [Anaerolinea sp.]|nr:hypothetical protein [Anaerolinea sp.]